MIKTLIIYIILTLNDPMNIAKMITNKSVLLALGLSLLVPSQSIFATDSDTEFTRIDGNDISNNPTAQKILEKIELSKKILAQMKEKKTMISEQQKLIEEQRKQAKEKLEQDLARMDKDYEAFTPRNAHATFLTNVNATYHGIYWDQFNYMDEKIQLAKAAKKKVIEDGGSIREAFEAYHKFAAMTRVEMIKLNQDLNIKYGFTDSELQAYFDQDGKLPRYEDDQTPCFSCQKYELVAQKIIADSLKKEKT